MFSQIVGVGLAVATVGILTPFAAIAQPETAQYDSVGVLGELAQKPNIGTVILPEGTIVFSQTNRIAVRVYNSSGATRLNLYNKQTGMTELLGVPVTVQATSTGVTYRHSGNQSVTVAIANSGAQTITINGTSQQTNQAVTGTISYLPRIALPPNAVVEAILVEASTKKVLSSQQIAANGRQIPFPFTLPYDPGQINQRSSYTVQSRITVEGETQFVTRDQFSVITNNNPSTVAVRVEQPAPMKANNATTDAAMLKNTVWQLEQIMYRDGQQLEANNLGDYTVQFMDDGQLAIRADCNRALGRFTEAGDDGLSINLGPTTLAACPPESIGSEYLRALQDSSAYFFQDGKLFIALKSGAGMMQFSQ
ncbi:YbaY family lipoprotein [[Limnothrix rosea] IAM M-220]|uniref:YbaY family lipoprotein n=1 Tax=[Limnothrix rosea] IAM M-220 TaxID=454133 RepID=UPI00095AA057|nr:YbaY family lipoprotein [[Limnothrix rosea] IAM M-220]OKH19742.1 hypothetical protein NIES208_01025 [[Limnothrix rosea] IAM M-220]